MSFRRFICACALIFAGLLPSFTQVSGATMSIDDVVRVALENNREYLAAKARLEEAQALIRQAGMRPAPTVELETGIAIGSRESEYSAGYFHVFESRDKRNKRVAIAEIGLALAQAEVEERQRLLASEVKMRFVASASEQLKLMSVRALLPLAEENYRLTVRRVDLGDAAPLEQQLLFAESNRVRARQALFTAAAEAAAIELKTVAGLRSDEPLSISPDLGFADRNVTLTELQEHALKRRPDLRTLRLLEQQAAAEETLAQAEGRPDITASARFTHSRTSFDQFGFSESGAIVPLRDADNVVTFGVSIPLFNRKRAEPAIAVARSLQRQHGLRREYLERAIPQEVEAAYLRWNGAIRALAIVRTGVLEPSQKNLTVIREAYRLGQLRLFDVLNEQRSLVDLQLSVVDAQAEAARALVELERAIGGNLP
jgi:cobalt-zinc-cadmium efflux system outer membrane protein